VKNERVNLGHIRDAINDVEGCTGVGRDALMAERIRQDAVLRELEISGEAGKQLSNPTKENRPEIPWKQIAGVRDLWRQRAEPGLGRCSVGSSARHPRRANGRVVDDRAHTQCEH
jgi:hypothetical protein